MIILLNRSVTSEQEDLIHLALKIEGVSSSEVAQADGKIIVATGRAGLGIGFVKDLPGVSDVIPDKNSFKLVGRDEHPDDTIVRVGPVTIGGPRIAVIAGPCAVESRDQAFAVAYEARKYGAVIFRGGAFKPRSSPYSFQGLGEEGLKILAEIRQEVGMPVVTEITSTAQAKLMVKYVDMVQVGARNMQNFELLKCVGKLGIPVVLKRGLAATIEEWLMSAEYIMAAGTPQVVICERGIRTYEPYTRNTLDLSAIPVVRNLTHLPIIIDPSHATGIREKVAPMARAAIAAGADGLMVEMHTDPGHAMSDGAQSLFPEQFGKLMRDIYVIAPVINKQVDFGYLAKATAVDAVESRAPDGKTRVLYQGKPGVSDHKACLQYFGDNVEPTPTHSYKRIFDAIRDGQADYGIVPLEHSMTGSVHENYDLLLDYDLTIVGEITLRIVYSLAGLPGTDLADIERAVSSPTVFHHCDQFIESHADWERVTAQDVATAAEQVCNCGAKTTVAITTPDAAAAYGLEVIEEGVESNPRNYTRFVVVAREQHEHGNHNKSSLIYQTADRPGALLETLKVFADNGINLLKLESRPVAGRPWEYMFYVDLEADVASKDFEPVTNELSQHTDFLKVLGVY